MDDYKLYILASLNYNSIFGNNKKNYPINFDRSKDYVLKNKILAEAIKNKILIKDTNLYKKACAANMFD